MYGIRDPLTFLSDSIYFVLETEHFEVISRKLEVVFMFFFPVFCRGV